MRIYVVYDSGDPNLELLQGFMSRSRAEARCELLNELETRKMMPTDEKFDGWRFVEVDVEAES